MPETITDVAQSILDCVVAQLEADGLPVCEACIVAGSATPPADGCDCKCEGGQGRAWIRVESLDFDSRTPARNVGSEVTKCPKGAWNVRFEVGVWRCVKDQDGKKCAVLLQDALAMHRDLAALIVGVQCCAALTGVAWAPERAAPLGPDGGCVAATYRFAVQLNVLRGI